MAQSTSGSIYGSVPAGTTIVITNNSGFSRAVTADSSGRYNVGSLPVGNYTVEAQGFGKRQVTVTVGSRAQVTFDDIANLDTITVTGSQIPVIDVTQTDTRTVITAEQIERLPLRRSAEAIALLAPVPTLARQATRRFRVRSLSAVLEHRRMLSTSMDS